MDNNNYNEQQPLLNNDDVIINMDSDDIEPVDPIVDPIIDPIIDPTVDPHLNNEEETESTEIIIDIDPATGETIYNNWSKTNTDTVRNWKHSISTASFIYQTVLEKYKGKLDKFLIVALIFSTLNTIVSAVSSALLVVDDTSYIWIIFGFNVTMFILNGIVTVINGSIKIFKWDELVTSISNFIEKLDGFYATISSQLVLPAKLRGNAVEFIKDENIDYVRLMQQSPDLTPSDYKLAGGKYKEFLEDNSLNFKVAQKYNEDAVIDII